MALFKPAFWKKFLDGTPHYLARHYWWAYLWRPAIWFFDHQPIINLILFGQYQRLLDQTLKCLEHRPEGRFLQLTCVYGKLTAELLKRQGSEPLYLVDVASAQLEASIRRLSAEQRRRLLRLRMNAEQLAFADNCFSCVLIFFLMHEMPPEARRRTLAQSLRVLRPGGRLVITEYAETPRQHWIYRLRPLRSQLLYWEPFLQGFWNEKLDALLENEALKQGKTLRKLESHPVFNGFYRVLVYQLD